MTVMWRCPRTFCLLFLIGLKMQTADSAPELPLYLHSILKNRTAHACDGDTLSIECPFRMTVAILSAFYGRHAHSQYVCLSDSTNKTREGDTECTSHDTVQKIMTQCQDRRSCHVPVSRLELGPGLCPLRNKYLLVSYQCQPEHYRTRMVCEHERLRLACKNGSVLAIFSASFGHVPRGGPRCHQDQEVPISMECLSLSALRKVSRRCDGRPSCSILADTQTFGDPCFPNTRKHLRVSFTCVPPYLLEGDGRAVDTLMISDYTHGVSERVTLCFVSGICSGLVFLLCLFGLRSTVLRDVKDLVCDLRDEIKASRRHSRELKEDFYNSDVSDTTPFYYITQSYSEKDTHCPSVLVMEMDDDDVEQTRDLQKGLCGDPKSNAQTSVAAFQG